MELEGPKRSFSFLKSVGLSISVFILDRHRGIAKWIRESQPRCAHFFDIWYIARSIGKAMIKLSKEKGCKKIGDWVKGVRNHLYWCVTSTKQRFQELIAAKWQSFIQYVANKHDGHPTPIFKKCAHQEIRSQRWIKTGREKVYLYHTPVRKAGKIFNFMLFNWLTLYIVSCPFSTPLPTPNIHVCMHAKQVFLLWLYLEYSYIALINRFSDHDNINVFDLT